jgi:hypothetical protein
MIATSKMAQMKNTTRITWSVRRARWLICTGHLLHGGTQVQGVQHTASRAL